MLLTTGKLEMTFWHWAEHKGKLDILLQVWEWAEEKTTKEEINNIVLLLMDNAGISISIYLHPYCYICNTGPVQILYYNHNTCTKSPQLCQS